MKRIVGFVLALTLSLALTACSEEQASPAGPDEGNASPSVSEKGPASPAASETEPSQVPLPEIEYITVEEYQCPQFKIDADDNYEWLNETIKEQFQAFILRNRDGSIDEQSMDGIQVYISSSGPIISVLLRQHLTILYGLDRPVWGICYNYKDHTGLSEPEYYTCLLELGYSHTEVKKMVWEIWELLNQKGRETNSLFESVSVDYLYFDTNSDPVLVVNASEIGEGTDMAWAHVYYYSPVEHAFVNGPWTNPDGPSGTAS